MTGPWPPNTTKAADLNPADWFQDGFVLAKQYAYAAPVSTTQTAQLPRDYETTARMVAEQQTALAGVRLAGIINDAFK